jgi:hypothetical protein
MNVSTLKNPKLRLAENVARMEYGEVCVEDTGGKTWGKESTWKTEAYMEG